MRFTSTLIGYFRNRLLSTVSRGNRKCYLKHVQVALSYSYLDLLKSISFCDCLPVSLPITISWVCGYVGRWGESSNGWPPRVEDRDAVVARYPWGPRSHRPKWLCMVSARYFKLAGAYVSSAPLPQSRVDEKINIVTAQKIRLTYTSCYIDVVKLELVEILKMK